MLQESRIAAKPGNQSLAAVKTIAARGTAMLVLLVPALWNGFPLLQYDTGGYIARWYEGTLEVSRSTVYGLFLNLLARPDFWPAILVQAALTVWVISLLLRTHGLKNPLALPATIVLLSVFTALPWIADVLLTDIFAGLSVIAVYLLALRFEALRRSERIGLFLLVAVSAATHSATFMVLMCLLAAGAAASIAGVRAIARPALAYGALALVLGASMLLAANYAVAGRLAWTPGGDAIVFGRMLQAGIVGRYLDDHCPDPSLKLCGYRNQLPATADEFFWGDSIFNQLGRFDGLDAEMRRIVLESLAAYPWLEFESAVTATARQLVSVASGYGFHNEIWHTYAMLDRYAPGTRDAMRAAPQQKGEIDFRSLNRLHVPVAFASMALLPVLIVVTWRSRRFTDLAPFLSTAAIAILANAAVCGALSNPNDRYGSRMVWLAPLALVLVAFAAMRCTGRETDFHTKLPPSVT
jgi:hypothetical protein